MSWAGGGWFGGTGSGGGSTPTPGTGPVAGAVITAARATHPAFSPETIANDVALIELGTIQRDLLSLAEERNPDIRITSATLSLATWEAEQTLPGNDFVRDVTVVFSNGQTTALNLVNASDRFRPTKRYSGYIENDTLVLIGTATDWTGVTELIVRYAPVVVDPTALDTALYLPDSAFTALKAQLASFMAARAQAMGAERVDVADFARRAEIATNAWLRKIASAGRPRNKQITAVW